MVMTKEKLDPEKVKKLEEICMQYKEKQGALIMVLHKAQELFGYLPPEVQKIVSKKLNVPESEVHGVVTFYSYFTMEPTGDYIVRVCMGTACYVKGAPKVLDRLSELLEIPVGKTTADRKFKLEVNRCVGACGLAPVVTVNDVDVFDRVKPSNTERIIEKYK